MKRTLFAMVLALALLGSSVGEQRKRHSNPPRCKDCDQHTWSYTGTRGPQYWGTLCDPICSAGREQSPIFIVNAVYNEHLPTISYNREGENPVLNLKNYGFTPKVSYASNTGAATYIQFSDSNVRYQFDELHFHRPGEHRLPGRSYAMEMHMVHKAPEGDVAVAVLIKQGNRNPKFDRIFAIPPATARCQGPSIPYQNVYDLLPSDRQHYYTYPGSLTTPDCSEPVKFVVLNGDIELSTGQINTFRQYLSRQGFVATNRPLQDLHGRRVETNVRQSLK